MDGQKWVLETAEDLNYPERRELTWKLPTEALHDRFFAWNFGQLYIDTFNFCRKFFGQVDINSPYSPWLTDFSDEFYSHVKSVACPDTFLQGWDGLLRNGLEREQLAIGIIYRVLDDQTFSRLLFGCSKSHEKILESMDSEYVDCEGFRRANLRFEANKLYLHSNRGKPPHFWSGVDRVALQLVHLLLPMYNMTAEKRQWNVPSLQDLYQSLHHIVAYAAWITIAVQRTPAITILELPQPGRPYKNTWQSASEQILQRSSDRAREYDKEHKVAPQLGNRVARVKIAVMPGVRRLVKVDNKSYRQFTVLRPHAVFYKGWGDDQREFAGWVSLEEHVQLMRERRREVTFGIARAMFIMVLILYFLWNAFQWYRNGECPNILRELGPGLSSIAAGTAWTGLKARVQGTTGVPLDKE